MTYNTLLTRALQAILFLLFSTWLVLFFIHPVILFNDSPAYFTDAKNLFTPGYTTFRPVLYPIFLRIADQLPVKISVLTYLINCASLYCLARVATGKKHFFSRKNTAVLAGIFLLPGVWSYCGTYLTESLVFSIELWIFIFLLKILFPSRHQQPLITVLYSLLICILAMALKPWLMVIVLLLGVLLVLTSLFFRFFRSKRLASLIFLGVSVLAFVTTFNYNRSKSQEKMNMVILMLSTGGEKLQERLANDKNLSSDSAAFIKSLISDIDLINNRYHRNPWTASETNELKLLNIYDRSYAPSIEKAFRIMYLERFNDMADLALISVKRYLHLHAGLACLNEAYGPRLPVIHPFAIRVLFVSGLIWIIYWLRQRDPSNRKMAVLGSIGRFIKMNRELLTFTGINLVAGVIFSLMLCVAGGVELSRTVLPATIMQLIAVTSLLLKKQ